MRKKTMSKFFDNIMWYLIYLLPLIIYICYCSSSGSMIPYIDFVTTTGFVPFSDNIIFTTLSSLFSADGIVPLFANSSIFAYFSYFISVYLVHLLVDVVLFIPRLCHKYMKVFYQEED